MVSTMIVSFVILMIAFLSAFLYDLVPCQPC